MKIIRVITIVLLGFVGLAAIFGGWGLMNDPSGQALQFDQSWLDKTPFTTYFVPGLVLFMVIGLSSLTIASITLVRLDCCGELIITQGVVLIAWLTSEILMGFNMPYANYIFYSIGGLLIIMGFLLYKDQHQLSVL